MTAVTDSTFASPYRHQGPSLEQSPAAATSPLVLAKVIRLNSANQTQLSHLIISLSTNGAVVD